MTSEVQTLSQQFATEVGGAIVCAAIGSDDDKSRLFPALPEESRAKYESLAASIAQGFSEFTDAPVSAAANILLDGAEQHDDNRTLVITESYRQLAQALSRPGDVGKDRITPMNVDGGKWMASIGGELQKAATMLDVGGDQGDVKLTATILIKRDGFTYEIVTDVQLKAGKQGRTQSAVRAQLTDGVLRPYDGNAIAESRKAKTIKSTTKKQPKKDKPVVTVNGFANGTVVLVDLDNKGEFTDTQKGVILSCADDVYQVDIGSATVPVTPDRLKLAA